MARTRRLTDLIDGVLASAEFPNGPLAVALSGGADSAALALILQSSGAELVAVHVNHGLDASAFMEKAAREVASRLDVAVEVEHVTLLTGASPEARARDARYQVLTRYELPVMTAHTRDDNAETVLINLIRGTGPAGLTGIPRHRPPNIFRPILHVSRSTTREIATLGGLGYVDDPMNEDDLLLRTRVRHEVIPLLAGLNPQIVDSLARTSDALGRDAMLFEEMVGRADAGPIPVSVLATLPRPVADRLILLTLREVGIAHPTDLMDRIWSVVSGETRRQDLSHGHVVRREGALLVIE